MNTVSDFIVSRLSEWGMKRVYGCPGNRNMEGNC
jgi:thiamine pyrophosphate-dependent acetolactate synthase large subunit-like protein